MGPVRPSGGNYNQYGTTTSQSGLGYNSGGAFQGEQGSSDRRIQRNPQPSSPPLQGVRIHDQQRHLQPTRAGTRDTSRRSGGPPVGTRARMT
jgi:hypothetical protein